jgi:hypothetical protein
MRNITLKSIKKFRILVSFYAFLRTRCIILIAGKAILPASCVVLHPFIVILHVSCTISLHFGAILGIIFLALAMHLFLMTQFFKSVLLTILNEVFFFFFKFGISLYFKGTLLARCVILN